MTENERVKQLRKAKGLTLEKFGKALGIQSSAVSKIERGETRLTPQNRLAICREFGVREEWLRDGEGEMDLDNGTFDLDELADKYHATDLERRLVRAYFELDEVTRKMVMEKFSGVFQKNDDDLGSQSDRDLIDAQEIAAQIIQDKKAKDASPVSSGAAGEKKEA